MAALTSADSVIYSTIKFAGDNPELSFTTIPSLSYKIEYKNEFNDPEWQDLISGLIATADSTSHLDTTFNNLARRFYRILQE